MTAWTLAAAAVIALLGMYARFRHRHLNVAREMQEDFFKAAGALVDAADTPESIVDLVEVMANLITERFAPWLILIRLIDGKVRNLNHSPSDNILAIQRDIKALRDPLDQQFAKASTTCILAITYSSTLIGWIIRRVALYGADKVNRRRFGGEYDAEALLFGLTGLYGGAKI